MILNKFHFIPIKLLNNIKFNSGRKKGQITVRHKGGGIKHLYTNVDFRNYNLDSTLALILKFYLDFSRTSIVMLVIFLSGYLKGTYKLYLHGHSLKIGDLISFSNQFPIKIGSYRNLSQLFAGLTIYNLTNTPSGLCTIARSLGTKAKIIYYTKKYVCVKLPSGQFKLFHNKCKAVVGQNSFLYKKIQTFKASIRKFKNLRPTVRGVAMNAFDHPHGGGCGKTSIGLCSSKTPWGKFHYGVRTKFSKDINKFRFINIIK